MDQELKRLSGWEEVGRGEHELGMSGEGHLSEHLLAAVTPRALVRGHLAQRSVGVKSSQDVGGLKMEHQCYNGTWKVQE